MSAGAKILLDAMNGAGARASEQTAAKLAYGTVASINPLAITRDGEADSAPLTEEFLVLSVTCKPFSINTAVHSHSVPQVATEVAGVLEPHAHSVPENITAPSLNSLVIWSGLRVGERVVLLSFNQNQRFFVERGGFPV